MECLKLDAIRVAKGMESWWDDLEVYALVSGVDPVQAKPNIKLVHLPYLHHEDTDYFPSQVLVFWSDFRFSAANIQFWDHGSGINYKEVLEAIIRGGHCRPGRRRGPGVLLDPRPGRRHPGRHALQLVAGLDTLLDTFYVLEKGRPTWPGLGAGGAVQVDLAPWVLQPQFECGPIEPAEPSRPTPTIRIDPFDQVRCVGNGS